MILTCPACHARFSVADHLVPAAGRNVRCSKCSHVWHVEKTSFSDELASLVASLPEEASVPAPATVEVMIPELAAFEAPPPPAKTRQPVRRAGDKKTVLKAKPFKIAMPVLAVLWLVLAFITYSPQWSRMSGLSGIYQLFGATPTDGLSFADITMTREQEGSKTKFILAGNIRNSSSSTRLVPTVRVQLRDKQNNVIWGREYPVNTMLKAGEVYPFRISNVETAFAKSVARVVVDMGNAMQLLVR